MSVTRMTPEQARQLSLAEQHDWFRRATSRRALLRGGIVGAGTLIAGPALLGGTAAAATQRPTPMLLTRADRPSGALVPAFGRHIAFGADPTSQLTVSWQVPTPVSNPFLRVAAAPGDFGERIEAEVRTLTTLRSDTSPVDSVPPAAPATITQYYLHAKVSGLHAGQTYYYSVGHQGLDPARNVDVGSFSTAPRDRRPFTFTAFGDQGVSYDAVATAMLIRAQNPAFHLHAGDLAYADPTGHGLITDSYDPRVWDSFFAQIESVAGSVPWQPAVGNHEMEAWYSPDGYGGQQARFDFPGKATGSAPPVYYSFVYGNVGVVSLDCNDVSYEIPANYGYSGGGQTAWLRSTLAALRGNPEIDFIVAQFHNCAYSTCTGHGSEGGARQYWAPLFDAYQVDLVINGHNHAYERTDPIRGGSATGAAPIGATIHPATQGTTYVLAGGAGNSLYTFTASDSYAGNVTSPSSVTSYVNETGGAKVNETVSWSRVRYTGYGLLVMDSRPGQHPGAPSTLLVRGLAGDGTEVDQFTLVRQRDR